MLNMQEVITPKVTPHLARHGSLWVRLQLGGTGYILKPDEALDLANNLVDTAEAISVVRPIDETLEKSA